MMSDRCYSGRRSLKETFVEGVKELVMKASQQERYHNDRGSDARVLNVIVLGFLRIEL